MVVTNYIMLLSRNLTDFTETGFYSFLKDLGIPRTPLCHGAGSHLSEGRDMAIVGFKHKESLGACYYPFYLRSRDNGNRGKSLLIFDSKESLGRFQKAYNSRKRKGAPLPYTGFFGFKDQVKKEYPLLGQNPSILVGTSTRIIDLLRQDYLKEEDWKVLLMWVDHPEQGFFNDMEFIISKLKVQQRIFMTPRPCNESLWEPLLRSPQLLTPVMGFGKRTRIREIYFSHEENRRRLLPELVSRVRGSKLILCGDKTDENALSPLERIPHVRVALMREPGSYSDVQTVFIYAQPDSPEELDRALLNLSRVSFQGKIEILLNKTDTFEFHTIKEMLDVGITKDEMQEKLLLFKENVESIIDRIQNEEDLDEMQLYKKLFKKSVPFHMRSYVGAYLLKNTMGKSLKKSSGNKATLFISIGRNRRVYPRDLVGLFSAAAGISKSEIGDIKILDSYSFMEINPKSAEKAIEVLDGTEYRGRKITVNYAKKKS